MDQKVYLQGSGTSGKWRDLEEFADEFLPDYWKDVPAEFLTMVMMAAQYTCLMNLPCPF